MTRETKSLRNVGLVLMSITQTPVAEICRFTTILILDPNLHVDLTYINVKFIKIEIQKCNIMQNVVMVCRPLLFTKYKDFTQNK